MPAPKTPPNFVSKIITAVRKDPQKAAILTVLVAILVVLQFRLALQSKAGPSKATAAATQVPSNNTASGNGAGARGDVRNALHAWLDQPAEAVSRNLFA